MGLSVCIMLFLTLVCSTTIQAKFDRVKLDIPAVIGYNYSEDIEQKLPENWQSRFIPRGGNMNTNERSSTINLDLGLNIEPIWELSSYKIGLPIFYYASVWDGNEILSLERTVGYTTVNWWDEVTVLSIKLKKTTPAVGVSIYKGRWKLQYAIQGYKLYYQDYRGEDRYGARNTSHSIGTRGIEDGTCHRLDLSYTPKDFNTSIGVFYERVGSNVWSTGVVFNFFICNLLTAETK